MKRIVLCLLILAMLLSVAACGGDPGSDRIDSHSGKPVRDPKDPDELTEPEETEPVQTPEEPAVTPLSVLTCKNYRNEWTDDYIRLGEVSWDSLILSEEHAALYPELAEALRQWNADYQELAEEKLASMLPDARESVAQMGADFPGFHDETVCSVQRADNRILSVRWDYDIYTGGMRPYFGTICMNLDPVTGENLSLSQILMDTRGLPQLLEQALLDKYQDLPADTFDGVAGYLESYDPEAYTWTLGYQGITFYFGAAELAAGAVGPLTVTLWFDAYPGLFISEYTQAPSGGYAFALAMSNETDVDLMPGDSGFDRLTVISTETDGLYIGTNGNAYQNTQYHAYYANAYLVTQDNQKFYLYVESSSDNDYRVLYIYSLTGAGPELVSTLSGHGFTGVWDEDYGEYGTYFTQVFNDPSHFLLSTRTDLLSTLTGVRYYHMGANGVPLEETEYYTLKDVQHQLVSKIDLEVLMLPDQTTETIPAGSDFYFLRTNNQTYVDMRLADGRECRILVKHDGWPSKVNGLPEDECFEGMMYAG